MTKTYRQAFPLDGPDTVLDAGWIWAVTRKAAQIVREHFAIVMSPVPHPCGEDDMWASTYQLDHIPTGYVCHRMTFVPIPRDHCERMADALASLGFDWSTDDVGAIKDFMGRPVQRRWLARARNAVELGRPLPMIGDVADELANQIDTAATAIRETPGAVVAAFAPSCSPKMPCPAADCEHCGGGGAS